MHIAIDARMAREPLSGPGRYAVNLIRALASLDHENQYSILQDRSFCSKITEAKNFETIWVDYSPLSLRTIFCLQYLLRKKRIDVFHSLFFLIPPMGSYIRVITIHDLMAVRFPNFFQGRSLPIRVYARLFSHIFIRLSINRSREIITDSLAVKNEIMQWKPECSEKITEISLAVDPSFRKLIEPEPVEEIKKKFALDERFILYIGNTRPYKNLPRLIKAFQILREDIRQNCQLVIGGGESRNLPDLRRLVRSLQLEDCVVFTGSLTDEEVVALMNAADVFVFPSLYEGFGLPPLEAMACGTPVITSNVSSLPEVVGDAALMVNPYNVEEIADAIYRLLGDMSLREKLIKRGLERVKLFSWEKTAKETLEVYKAVMNKKTDCNFL